MAEPSRYSVKGETINGVLKNKLHITDQKALEDTETVLLSDTYEYFFQVLESRKITFDIKLIFRIHKYFLGTLYNWAGSIRNVEISKDGVLFCASSQIQKELKKLDQFIKKNLPTEKDSKEQISNKLALIHCEFNAIHPFREGNGRTIRLFLDLLSVTSGFSITDYSKTSQKAYIQACIAGMQQNYVPMQKVIFKGISKI